MDIIPNVPAAVMSDNALLVEMRIAEDMVNEDASPAARPAADRSARRGRGPGQAW